ncbi:HlyD family secretion protein [Pararhodospirillum oryzae]|uniref:Secretion protein HlyD n=1 Tax=Pararhodospirillum oryzae TaxID=478448 RepID=A0A512HAY0_9PROT|nr:HlyD family secretion protein [Pararhodospirillum oryzae]GEO82540.1 secretion protein HlyD [Pararhodospirillum oryzae]
MAFKFIRTRTLLPLALGLIGALVILYAWRLPPFETNRETTDNAYVRGQVTVISAQGSGTVTEVAVRDFQDVHEGDLLVRIDDRIPTQKLEQALAALAVKQADLANADQSQRAAEARIVAAQAQMAGAQTALNTAEATLRRSEALLAKGVTTQQALDQSRTAQAQAHTAMEQADAALQVAQQEYQSILVGRQSQEADIRNAEAVVRLAQIDLQNTRVVAPQDGKLGEIGVRLGQYVTAGTQLTSLVPPKRWIIANFKETQLAGMRVGQTVTFTVDALDHRRFNGHIEELAPATGSEFSVLRPENATGNFIKVAQRVPVRIAIDPGQPAVSALVPGLSVVVSVDTGAPAP